MAAMFAVTTRTGMPMRVGDASLDPDVPTVFEGEVPKEVLFQETNLRIEPLSGLDALGGKPHRNPLGETVGGEPSDEAPKPVPASEHAAVVRARDELDGRLVAATTAKETAETELATVRSAREAAERSVAALTTELGGLRKELEETNGLLERNEGELREATETAAKAEAAHKQAIADLKSKHEGETKAAAEKAKADHDALVAKHKAEIEKLKAK